MQPVDTNWPGFQPLGCGSICTQGFALGWYRNAPLALEAIRRVWIFGERHTSAFSQTDPLPRRCNPWIRIGRAFSPRAVTLSAPRALPWAGIGARRWRLSIGARRWRSGHPPGVDFCGSGTTSAFLKLTHYRMLFILDLDSFAALKKAIQSFRPFDCAQGFTPAFARAEASLRGALFTARLNS